MSHRANVYDFDHTIYRGDASADFIVYCLRTQPKVWKHVPRQAMAMARYVFGVWDRQQVKQEAFRFLRDVPNINQTVDAFWRAHKHKLADWYGTKHQATDIIVSASPEFLLQPMARYLHVAALLATPMDPRTGHITGTNCRAQEKVRRVKQHDPDLVIDECYGDSPSDIHLLQLAKHGFMVRGDSLTPLADYTPSKLRQLRDPAFLRFLFVGAVNASLGIVFSYIIALLIGNPLLAYILGYSLSLIISYFLNAVITFKERQFSVRQFGTFCLSYIPNFAIVFSIVALLVGAWHVYSLIAYILAAVIAAPVTFLLLRNITFIKGHTK